MTHGGKSTRVCARETHSAAQCNTVQHTATHCKTLQYIWACCFAGCYDTTHEHPLWCMHHVTRVDGSCHTYEWSIPHKCLQAKDVCTTNEMCMGCVACIIGDYSWQEGQAESFCQTFECLEIFFKVECRSQIRAENPASNNSALKRAEVIQNKGSFINFKFMTSALT